MSENEILELLGKIPGNDLTLPALAAQMKTSVGVIPFIGAGMSAPFGFQQWTIFLRSAAKLAGKTRVVDKQIAAGQYEEAAETLITALTPSAFQDLMEGRFGDRVLEGKALTGSITLIPRLNSGPVITTNFDRLLEHVFQNAGCPFEDKFWHSKVDLAIPARKRNNPVLLR